MNAKEFFIKSDKVVLCACVLGIIVFSGLGIWQTKRLIWKEGLITRLEEKLVQQPIALNEFSEQYSVSKKDDDILSQRYSEQGGEFTPVRLRGEFLTDDFFLLNRSMDGKAGVNWLKIFASDDGRNILLNRGFIPFELKDAEKPDDISGRQEIVAMVRLARGRPKFMPANVPDENIWFYIDLPEISALSGVELVNYYAMVKNSPEGYDFPRAYNWRFDIPNNHLQYAITWFAFALITLIMGIYYQYRYINNRDL